MRIVIVGGGKLGHQIARNMLERKYSVKLIEKDKLKCMRLANELDVEVICGDGTEIEVLDEAGTKNADCVIAVTGSDQDNLVASQLARKEFKAAKVIARANDPRNLAALRKLGADIAVSSTEIITNLIEQEVDVSKMHLLATLNKGKAGICAITLPRNTALDGVQLKDITLPQGSLIISVVRGDSMMIPNGFTVIRANDEIVAVCENKSQKKLMEILGAQEE
ncbi:potassium channel family protein [Caproiciproducens sp. R1]|jgi:K+ transport systems, NAD-binding component|uniref:potassium channel family protein n=1 Tax=Caproiciproducens sp. R1 TaxID=3435000 RepID=UPI000570D15A|nr:TrkA family potassium uptake protein [Oscillospiraceae bacterium]